MPVLDMPLEKLREYKGMNPRPDDFDEFWDKSIEEMKALDPQVELRKSSFETDVADCWDMFFNGCGGARVYAKLLIPKNLKGKAPAILNFHGYSGKSHEWVEHLGYAASGFVCADLDCRGQAGLSEDSVRVSGNTLEGFITKGLLDEPEKLYYRNVFLDTAMLARIIMDMEEVDSSKVCAKGGSQGGALTLACAALEPRIKLAMACYPFLSDYKRTWDMDLDKDAYKDLKAFFRQKDPFHEREEEFFKKLGYTDIQFLAPRIKAKVHMFTGLQDNICPPSTQFAAFNKMTCEKESHILPDFGHEYLPGVEEKIYMMAMKLK